MNIDITNEEKIEALTKSEEYRNNMHHLNKSSIKYILELTVAPVPQKNMPDFYRLPDNLKDLMENPAIIDRSHPDHRYAAALFNKLHGIE